MITVLKDTAGDLRPVTEWAPGCWVDAVAPTPDEINQLSHGLRVPREWIDHALDLDERARIEREDGALLIVLRLPHHQDPPADVPYITVPVGILIADGLLATVCAVENAVIRSLASGQVRQLSTAKSNRFLLQLLFAAADKYLDYVREINKAADKLEGKLQRSLRNEEVLELLKHQKSLVYFTTGLKSNELTLDRLQSSHLFEKYPEDQELLADVLTEIQQALEMASISENILSQMMDAFASIISNNLNVVMKFLASMTILLSLPSLVASIYGMNVGLPLQQHPQAFVFVMGLSLAISIVVAIIFWRKDWF
ncbi:MAG TPA: magnesium transporter CorA family protein [Anaerolineales bacterium]|nr:magnesium transporter CorA family protein [Anaerolineales bacterium]HLF02021.1 magnesium transporter CorA family protein [Anaerolineales bacterium]